MMLSRRLHSFTFIPATSIVIAAILAISLHQPGADLFTLRLGSAPAEAIQPPIQPPRVRWVPHPKQGSVGRTLSGGRRGQTTIGCTDESTLAGAKGLRSAAKVPPTVLTLLTPPMTAGLYTLSAQPIFLWHLSTPGKVSAQFILSDANVAEPIFTQTVTMPHSGLARINLPTHLSLKAEQKYRWTVWLTCPEKSSGEIQARSFIERITRPTLRQQVMQKSDLDQAVTYAAEGIWYDALGAIIQGLQQQPDSPQLKFELQSLLSQIGINPKDLTVFSVPQGVSARHSPEVSPMTYGF
jgi:hypothetical protein